MLILGATELVKLIPREIAQLTCFVIAVSYLLTRNINKSLQFIKSCKSSM